MSFDPLAILRLGSGVAKAALRTGTSKPIDGASFDELLNKARAGEISSGVPVRVTRESGVALSESQLARIAVAADKAEAEGAARAIVLIDGQVLSLDVPTRTITGAVDPSKTQVQAGHDAVITVAAESSPRPAPAGSLLLSRLKPLITRRESGGVDSRAA